MSRALLIPVSTRAFDSGGGAGEADVKEVAAVRGGDGVAKGLEVAEGVVTPTGAAEFGGGCRG